MDAAVKYNRNGCAKTQAPSAKSAVYPVMQIKADEASVKKFRESLSRLGDVFVNDAFGMRRVQGVGNFDRQTK